MWTAATTPAGVDAYSPFSSASDVELGKLSLPSVLVVSDDVVGDVHGGFGIHHRLKGIVAQGS